MCHIITDVEKASDYVKRCLKVLGLKQRELGAKIGCTRETIGRWARGEHEPCYEDVRKLDALMAAAGKRKKR